MRNRMINLGNRMAAVFAIVAIGIVVTLSACSRAVETKKESEAREEVAKIEAAKDKRDRDQSVSDRKNQVTESKLVAEAVPPSIDSVVGYSVVGGVANQPAAARMMVGAPPPPSQFNTEEYGQITENGFQRVTDHPLSTFSIDVDRASYSNVRRFLTMGQLPPADAVRIEEMINYFTYDYPQPVGSNPFSIITDVARCPWNPKNRLVHVGLQGKSIDARDLPPSNLVFLIDVSGSMDQPDKLPLLKSAFGMLVEQLGSDDRVAIVVYAGAAGLVLPSTSGAAKGTILEAIDHLQAGGSTAGGEGIELAYSVARQQFIRGGNNRVILATDGDFNVGVTSDGELERIIEKKRRDGIFLTVLGFGTGNIKDSKMEILADKGNGNYSYIDSELEAKKVLVHELGGTLFTIAKDVKIQVEFNPARVEAYRLVGYENRMLRSEDFNDDRKDAGEIGAGHSVTALYEIVPAGGDVPAGKVDPLKYQTRKATAVAESQEMLTLKVRYKEPDGDQSLLLSRTVNDASGTMSENLQFAAAVAEFGMLLRNSEYRGDATWDEAARLAGGALGRDKTGYRSELLRLVESARNLAERKQITEGR